LLHKHEPIAEEEMCWISPEHTICEVLREIYWTTDDKNIRLKCRVATSMAKSMTEKLTEYKEEWEKGFWDENKKYRDVIHRRKKKLLKMFLKGYNA
jgi:hypothetical protein